MNRYFFKGIKYFLTKNSNKIGVAFLVIFLTDSENLVLREFFQGTDLKDIPKILNEERQTWSRLEKDGRMQKEVDIRSISKFKSLALKKLRKELLTRADESFLDYSPQGITKEERDRSEKDFNLLINHGILRGYDFRDDRFVYLFYSPTKESLLHWQEHSCRNDDCEKDCKDILHQFSKEHGINSNDLTQPSIPKKFDEILKLILLRERNEQNE